MSGRFAFLLWPALAAGCAEPSEELLAEGAGESGETGVSDLSLDLAPEDALSDDVASNERGLARSTLRWRTGYGGVADDQLHAWGGDTKDGLGVQPVALVGELCEGSDECEAGTQCVADTIDSDGQLRCLAVCVAATDGSPDPVVCVDDDGCCVDAAVCNDDGSCLAPSGDGGGGSGDGGSDPDADGSGCNEGCDHDRDDDGLWNACDANPDQSCSADADNDGIRDSCDANDMDSDDGCFGCRLRARSSTTTLAFLIILLASRQRRRRRR